MRSHFYIKLSEFYYSLFFIFLFLFLFFFFFFILNS